MHASQSLYWHYSHFIADNGSILLLLMFACFKVFAESASFEGRLDGKRD